MEWRHFLTYLWNDPRKYELKNCPFIYPVELIRLPDTASLQCRHQRTEVQESWEYHQPSLAVCSVVAWTEHNSHSYLSSTNCRRAKKKTCTTNVKLNYRVPTSFYRQKKIPGLSQTVVNFFPDLLVACQHSDTKTNRSYWGGVYDD